MTTYKGFVSLWRTGGMEDTFTVRQHLSHCEFQNSMCRFCLGCSIVLCPLSSMFFYPASGISHFLITSIFLFQQLSMDISSLDFADSVEQDVHKLQMHWKAVLFFFFYCCNVEVHQITQLSSSHYILHSFLNSAVSVYSYFFLYGLYSHTILMSLSFGRIKGKIVWTENQFLYV